MRALALLLAAGAAAADPVDLFRVACLEGAGSAAVPELAPVPLDAPPDVALYPEAPAVLLTADPEGYGAGAGGPHLVLVGDAPAPEYCAVIAPVAPWDARAALADVLVAARPIAAAGGFADPEADHFLLDGDRLLTVACPARPDAAPATALILNDFAAAAAPPAGWAGFRAAAEAIPPGLPEAGTLSCIPFVA